MVTAGAQVYLLRDYPGWSRWLTPLVVGAGLVSAETLVTARLQPRRLARAGLVAAGVAMASLLVAPTTWAAYSVTHTVSAGIPTAGPAAQSTGGTGGGPGRANGVPGGAEGSLSSTRHESVLRWRIEVLSARRHSDHAGRPREERNDAYARRRG